MRRSKRIEKDSPIRDTCASLLGCLFLVVFWTSRLGSQEPPGAEQDQPLRDSIAAILTDHQGDVSVAVTHLETGDHVEIDATRPMPTASLIKLPLLVAAYHAAEQGNVDLDEPVKLTAADKVPGSGLLTDHIAVGASLRLRDYVRLMIRYSDNTATNIVIDRLGLSKTNELMESLGLPNTKLHAKVYRSDTSILPNRSRRFGLGSTTAKEMVQLISLLHHGELCEPATREEILDHLLSCDDRTKLARQLATDVKIAHKSGAVAKSRTDAGIIYCASGPVAVCVLTNHNEDQRWTDDNASNVLCGKIGQAIANRFGSTKTSPVVQEGAFGRTVEALQRTLNHRLKPSPGLAIDGDFGPATRRAVERFQRENGLPEDGLVQADTWNSLGTLIERDDPVPTPEQIRAQVLPISPESPLTGPPIVTCRAWAIGDAGGTVLWASNEDQSLEAASTTKIMSAVVVMNHAHDDPALLDEVVTFSERADLTVGSTSGLRAGEQVSVRELLYGLLLPSGNDASVALAEHVGARLTDSSSRQLRYDAFIAAMNDTAAELGMMNTRYTNPHGLPDSAQGISAADLLRLGGARHE